MGQPLPGEFASLERSSDQSGFEQPFEIAHAVQNANNFQGLRFRDMPARAAALRLLSKKEARIVNSGFHPVGGGYAIATASGVNR